MNKYRLCLLASSIVVLTACGGGSGSSGVTEPSNNVSGNRIPVAVAGAKQTVNLESKVQLDGSNSSDQDKDSLTYQWQIKDKPAQSKAELTDAATVHPSFIPDVAGKYVVQLIVNDGKASSSPSIVEITVNKINHAPVAVAGNPQNVTLGDLVQLDGGQSSDEDQDELTYQWQIKDRPSQSQVILSNATLVNPTFKPDIVGKYILELKVNDAKLDSLVSSVEINVVRGNAAPVAVISSVPKEIKVGTQQVFDGRQSNDNDQDPLTYQWSLESKPNNSTAQFIQAQSSQPSIIFDQVGTYKIGLIVNDGQVNSNMTTATVNVVRNNTAPVAVAGDKQTVKIGDTVFLNGSQSSDADHDKLTYQWSMTSKPLGSQATLNSLVTAQPSFVADVEGNYVLGLIVNDGYISSQPSNVTITAEARPELVLSGEDSFWGNITTYPWPYASDSTFQVNSSCAGNGCNNYVDLVNYNLEAKGQKFTIINLKATSSNTNYPAFFGGLTDNQVVQKGEKVNFGLRLTKTQNKQVEVNYSFTIKETGQTFNYKATGFTN